MRRWQYKRTSKSLLLFVCPVMLEAVATSNEGSDLPSQEAASCPLVGYILGCILWTKVTSSTANKGAMHESPFSFLSGEGEEKSQKERPIGKDAEKARNKAHCCDLPCFVLFLFIVLSSYNLCTSNVFSHHITNYRCC